METQKTVTDWAEETFGPADDPSVLIRRADIELKELLEAVQARDVQEIGKETADVVILLMRVLEQHGLDFQEVLDAKMEENRGRTWIKKGDGTGSHVKPPQ